MARAKPKRSEPSDSRYAEVQARYEAARQHLSEWRTAARESYDFYASRQWSPEDIAKLEGQMRAAITFNRAKILIDAVLGYEENNRQETRYIPRTLGDAQVNEMLTSAADYFRDQCDAEFHESDAFRDTAISGLGWTNDRLSDDANPEYDIIRERVDPFEMCHDPSSRMPNLADARYIFRTRWMSKAEVRHLFPKWDGEITDNVDWMHGARDEETSPGDNNPRSHYKGGSDDSSTDSVERDIPVIEYQYIDKRPCHYVINPETGQPKELTDEQYDAKKAEIETLGLKHYTKNKIKHCREFWIGGKPVKDDVIYPHGYTYHCITGFRDRNKGTWFGIMAALIDPQRWSNKWLSQILHNLNSSVKPGYDVEKGAIDNQSKFEENANKPGSVNVFVDGALQKKRVQYRQPAAMPTGHEKLLEYANKSFTDVSGVNQELLGMADREQPGVLEWQRKQSAVTLLAPLFGSLRRYRKMAGRTWLYLMTQHMSDGRMVRITQDETEQNVQFGQAPGQQPPQLPAPDPSQPPEAQQQAQQAQEQAAKWLRDWKNEDVTDYDVIVDQSSTAPNMKEATWATLTNILPIIGETIPPQMMMTLLEYSPLPESLLTKLKEQQKEMAANPQPSPEQQKIEFEREKAAMDIKAKQEDLKLQREKANLEMEIEREKAQLQMELEREKAANALEVERIKAGLKIQTEQLKANAEMQMDEQRFGFETEQADREMQRDERQFNQEMDLSERQGEQELAHKDKMSKQQLQAAKAKAAVKPKPEARA